MKFSHTEETRDGRQLDVLTDEENGLRIVVSRLGAELISMARINEAGNWIGFLYRGHEIKGGNHGFLRTKSWHLAASSTEGSGALLKYQITPDDFSPTEYPLKVSVDLTYQIDANGVGVLFEFRNHEWELTAHVSFGLHPGFG